uniref:Uncharacterized protein n=1 Tax=Mustela putorius furo TaxID=9669 RepID=M3YA67_MUSPF
MHAGGVDRAGGGPSPLGKKSCAPLSCHHIQQRQPCRSGTSGTESPGRWSAWGREAGSPPRWPFHAEPTSLRGVGAPGRGAERRAQLKKSVVAALLPQSCCHGNYHFTSKQRFYLFT